MTSLKKSETNDAEEEETLLVPREIAPNALA